MFSSRSSTARNLITQNVIGTQAYATSDQFVDSIGVNSSFSYVYGGYTWSTGSTMVNLLAASGIRHCRETINVGNTTVYQTLQSYCQSNPLAKFDFLTGLPGGTYNSTNFIQTSANAQIAAIATVATTYNVPVTTIEGINEPDLNSFSNANTLQWQEWLYEAIQNYSSLNGSLLINASINALTNIDASTSIIPYIQGQNVHIYLNRQPENTGFGTNGYGSLAWVKNYVAAPLQPTSGNLPIFITEMGGSSSPTAAEVNSDITGWDYAAEAIFVLRWFMYYFVGGISRQYHFCFCDNQSPVGTYGGFGLIDSSLNPKPIYTAIKNIITLMSDPGTQPNLGKLNYALSGSTTNVQQALFQKIDGSFILVLWIAQLNSNSTVVWNSSTLADEALSTAQTVSIAVTGFTSYATAVPNSTGTWGTNTTITNGTFNVSVTDSLLLIHINSATPIQHAASPATQVNGTTGSFYDTNGVSWAINSGMQITMGATVVASSANVVALYWDGTNIYQLNSTNSWYTQPLNGTAGVPTTQPSGYVVPVHAASSATQVNGTTGSFYDTNGVLWAINSGEQITMNGTVVSSSADVVTLYWTGTAIYQLNSTGSWYTQPLNGTAGVPTTQPSGYTLPPSPPTQVNGTNGSFVDTNSVVWTINSSAQIVMNSTVVSSSANVVTLYWTGSAIYQLNSTGSWYTQPLNGSAGTATTQPSGYVAPATVISTSGTPFPLGAFLGGQDVDGFSSNVTAFTQLMKAPPIAIDMFINYNDSLSTVVGNAGFDASTFAADPISSTSIPVVGFYLNTGLGGSPNPQDYSNQMISWSNGSNDSIVQGCVQAYKNNGFNNVFWRIDVEFNLNSVLNDSTIQSQWIAAFQHVSNVFRAAFVTYGVTGKIIWNPGLAGNQTGVNVTTGMWPGKQYVDIIAGDFYDDPEYYFQTYDWYNAGQQLNNTGAPGAISSGYNAMLYSGSEPHDSINKMHFYTYPNADAYSLNTGGTTTTVADLITFAEQQGLPVMMAETGCGQLGHDNATFPEWLYNTLAASTTPVAAVMIWDGGGGGEDYAFVGNTVSDPKPNQAAAWAKYFGGIT
jgi:hypothetical protein